MKSIEAAILAVTAITCLHQGQAHAQTPRITTEVLSLYGKLDEGCRGATPDDPLQPDVCEARDQAHRILNLMGTCLARRGQHDAATAPHRCGPNSLRAGE